MERFDSSTHQISLDRCDSRSTTSTTDIQLDALFDGIVSFGWAWPRLDQFHRFTLHLFLRPRSIL
ncbi:7499_t:CDS:1, partial [Acaulospora morrowiae]